MDLFIRPAGPADAEEIARVQTITWRATYGRLLSMQALDRVERSWDVAHWRRSLERTDDKSVTLVLDGPRTGIVGFCVAGPRRGKNDPILRSFQAEIYLLYLIPSVQKRGHGKRLMSAMARVLRARGVKSTLVWALATNQSAIGFYQCLSGSILMRCQKPFFGEPVNEIALGWRDIDVLARLPRNQSG
jgi:ribosomal protein S18 acetylase RimI-like enzyme